ncbi:MAG: Rieske (2Fe-2S) protein [Pyrinomonadaceae bacterium]|nr:Rieske (2Fe-2S) protein [Sphingobacteriaceae bacterium]
MERDEFLKSLGISFAMACTGLCFQACSKSDDAAPGGNPGSGPGGGSGGNSASVDISTMSAVGSQTTNNSVLFFRIAAGNTAASFVATQAFCPHQSGTLSWQAANNQIQCGLHQATYTSSGAVTGQPVGGGTTNALAVYPVTLNGTTLTATKG